MDNISIPDIPMDVLVSYDPISLYTSQINLRSNHHFNYHSILITLRGKLQVFIHHKMYELENNEILIANPIELYHISSTTPQDFHGIAIVFSPHYIQDMNTEQTDLNACFLKHSKDFLHLRQLDNLQLAEILRLCEEIMQCSKQPMIGTKILKKAALCQLLVIVNQIYNKEYSIPSEGSSLYSQKINPILQYIATHLHEPLSLDILAQQFFISKYHLCRIFKKATGYTIKEYISLHRILKACELLQKGTPMYTIYDTIGIKSPSYFITIFKRIMGVTPKKYLTQITETQKNIKE